MNTVLYARVSTDKQAEKDLSIPAQLQLMRDFARQHDWTIVEEFIEPGVSAKTAQRPVLQRLLAMVRDAQAKVDVVLVHKIDRLARNVYDHATIKALLLQHKIRLASVVENVDDSNTGQLVEYIMASMAQFYSANLADEVRKGMQQKVLKGGWPHMAPRGYIHVPKDEGQGTRIEIHPKVGPAMRKAFELYATGWYSLKSLAAMLSREGVAAHNGRPIAAAYLHNLLTNPFYVGRLRWKELEVAGAHEPLISVELFKRVQEALSHRFKQPGAKGSVNGFHLRGIAICASCRGHMTAGYQRVRWGYYRCARRGYSKALCSATKYCPSKLAHRAVEELCGKLRLPSATLESILKAARQLVEERMADSRQRTNSLRMRQAKLMEREMRLTEGFVAGDVSSNAYKATGTKLKAELRELETELTLLQRTPSELMTRVANMLQRATTVWELHEQLNDARQIELLRVVFQKIVLDETGLVGFTLRPPFDVIFKSRLNGSADPLKPTGNSPDTSDVRQIAKDIVHCAIESPQTELPANGSLTQS